MLTADDKKLSWWGMDMRPRSRRRLAVIATYFGYLGLMSMWFSDSWSWAGSLIAHPCWAFVLMVVACALWQWVSVFHVLKSFEDAPPRQRRVQVNGLDEREKKERDIAERWTLRWVALFAVIGASDYLRQAARHETVDPIEVAADLWLIAILCRTLAQARVLWTEPDPREMSGEVELVQS